MKQLTYEQAIKEQVKPQLNELGFTEIRISGIEMTENDWYEDMAHIYGMKMKISAKWVNGRRYTANLSVGFNAMHLEPEYKCTIINYGTLLDSILGC